MGMGSGTAVTSSSFKSATCWIEAIVKLLFCVNYDCW